MCGLPRLTVSTLPRSNTGWASTEDPTAPSHPKQSNEATGCWTRTAVTGPDIDYADAFDDDEGAGYLARQRWLRESECERFSTDLMRCCSSERAESQRSGPCARAKN